jgi:hypothetical protein
MFLLRRRQRRAKRGRRGAAAAGPVCTPFD